MCKLLIGSDEYIYKYRHNYYVSLKSGDFDLYKRYLRIFDQVRIVARTKEIDEISDQYIQLNPHEMEVFPIPFFRGPKEYALNYFSVKKAMKNVTDGCSSAVLRLPATVSFNVWQKVLKKKMNYAVEIVFDAYDGFKNESGIINKIIWYKIHLDLKKAANNADGVSCVTKEYLQRRYYSLKKNHFTSHYSSIALKPEFYTAPRKYQQKKQYTIVHVSNPITKDNRKGYLELINILSIIKLKGHDVNIKFIGGYDEDARDYYYGIAKKTGVNDKIDFLGYMSKESIRNVLIESDIFVFPTKSEGLPRVLIEAMAVALPCVSTMVSGNAELLQKEFLFDYKDIQGMALKVIELISRSDIYEEASEYNFNVSKEYEQSILENRRDEFYLNLKNTIN